MFLGDTDTGSCSSLGANARSLPHVIPHSPAGSSCCSESDVGCDCCPSSNVTRQRKSAQADIKREMILSMGCMDEEGGPYSEQSGRRTSMQEQVLRTLLLVATVALVLSILRLSDPYQLLVAVAALPGQAMQCLLPPGPLLWKYQWLTQGRPDPRPLWDVHDLLAEGTDWPHGSAQGFRIAVFGDGIKNVAIVGNGPLTTAQRAEIRAADRVVRFNAMNNRLADEPVDIWVVRFNNIPPLMYWGFEQLGDEEIVQVTEEARAVLFLGGSDHLNATEMYDSVERLLFWFPNITEDQTQQVNISGYWDVYNHMFSKNSSTTLETADTMPSSGLLGFLAVLGAIPRTVKVDLYGFNWSGKSYHFHQMSQEEYIVGMLRNLHKNMEIHPTACNGLYSCDALCDTNQFRLAVDEHNCREAVKKVKAGGVGTFVDQHALRHPEWAPVSVNKTPREGGESWLGLQPRWIGGASSSLLPPEDYDYEDDDDDDGGEEQADDEQLVVEEMLTDAVLKEPPQQQASGRKGLPEASSSSRTSRPMRRHAELPPEGHARKAMFEALGHSKATARALQPGRNATTMLQLGQDTGPPPQPGIDASVQALPVNMVGAQRVKIGRSSTHRKM